MLSGTHFYNQTIRKSVAVFGTIFNNIRIRKYNSTEERVPISYGPRQKFLASIESDRRDEAVAIKVPRMSFEISDISYDSATSLNKNNKIYFNDTATGKDVINQSVPYTLGMQLNILSKTQDEALQIMEQILPTFTPEYTVAIKDMNGPGSSVDVPIILEGVSFQDEYEGDFETRRTILHTLDFKMKIRFYGLTVNKALIRTVEADFYDSTLEARPDISIDRVTVTTGESDTADNFTATTTFGFDTTSIAATSTSEISALVNGVVASNSTKDIYTEASYNTSLNFIRNTDFWGKDIVGITGISPWNSRDNNKRAGTAITKRHVLFCEHSNFNLQAGDTMYFVTRDNTIVSRQIMAEVNHPATGFGNGDFNIAVLDENLPDTIEVLKVLPEDALSSYYSVGDLFFSFWVDQEEKGLIKNVTNIQASNGNISFGTATGLEDWYESAILYDSASPAFILLNNEAILVTVTTFGGGGNGDFISTPSMINDLNTMIASVDAAAGIDTGYTLTQFSLDPRVYSRYN